MKLTASCINVVFVLLLIAFSADAQNRENSSVAQNTTPGVEEFQALRERVQKFTLSNGIRVILLNRPVAPVFSGRVWVKVGGVNELPGKTGVSHMLEHMAFKGTETIGTKDYKREKKLLDRVEEVVSQIQVRPTEELYKEFQSLHEELETIWDENAFSKIYASQGARGINAGTGKDLTYYMVDLPSVAFELWCYMESERLLRPVFRQFYKEREVVGEERRTRVEDNPGGRMYEALLATAFVAHPNRLPVIGWKSDIERLTATDVAKLYEQYYRPDNIVLSIVGDVDPNLARPLIEKYFGRVPEKSGSVPQVDLIEPKQEGIRKAIVRFDAEPRLYMAFHKPAYPHIDDSQFAVMHSLLSDGRSSLLEKELVRQQQIATSVFTTEAPGALFPSVFVVGGTPKKGISNELLTAAIMKILKRLQDKQVSQEEIESVKRRVRVDVLSSLDSNSGLAQMLGNSELLWNDWETIFDSYKVILETTPTDIQRLAKDYFREDNKTLIYLEKKL